MFEYRAYPTARKSHRIALLCASQLERLCTKISSDIDDGILRELKENRRHRTREDWPALGLRSQDRVAGVPGGIQITFAAKFLDVERHERTPVIRVRINANLIKMSQREIVASRIFERKIKVDCNSMLAIIKAFDESLGKGLKSIIVGMLETGETQSPTRLNSSRNPEKEPK